MIIHSTSTWCFPLFIVLIVINPTHAAARLLAGGDQLVERVDGEIVQLVSDNPEAPPMFIDVAKVTIAQSVGWVR